MSVGLYRWSGDSKISRNAVPNLALLWTLLKDSREAAAYISPGREPRVSGEMRNESRRDDTGPHKVRCKLAED